MKKLVSSCLACALLSIGAVLATGSPASAQTEVLQEMYGRGVHAYYAGDYTEAYELLSAAIENGIEDPRAYYFRGMVAEATGRPEQAEGDWYQGAQLEAAGKIPGAIGPALARFQGPERLKLERIRDRAQLEAMSSAAQRRQQRYGPAPAAGQARQQPQAAQPQQSDQPQQPQAPVAPPPTPPAADDLDNPFADDVAEQPEVESQDALEGVTESAQTPPADQPAGDDADDADGDSPFDAGDQPAGEDPFGGGDDEADPFGGDAGADPFGGDDGGENPFGGSGDPFG